MQLLIILFLLLYGGKAGNLKEVEPLLESLGGEDVKKAIESAEEISSVISAVNSLGKGEKCGGEDPLQTIIEAFGSACGGSEKRGEDNNHNRCGGSESDNGSSESDNGSEGGGNGFRGGAVRDNGACNNYGNRNDAGGGMAGDGKTSGCGHSSRGYGKGSGSGYRGGGGRQTGERAEYSIGKNFPLAPVAKIADEGITCALSRYVALGE